MIFALIFIKGKGIGLDAPSVIAVSTKEAKGTFVAIGRKAQHTPWKNSS